MCEKGHICFWVVHQCRYTCGGQRTTLALIPWVPSLPSFLSSFLVAGTQHSDYPDLLNALEIAVSSRLPHLHPMSCFLTHDLSFYHVKIHPWDCFSTSLSQKNEVNDTVTQLTGITWLPGSIFSSRLWSVLVSTGHWGPDGPLTHWLRTRGVEGTCYSGSLGAFHLEEKESCRKYQGRVRKTPKSWN